MNPFLPGLRLGMQPPPDGSHGPAAGTRPVGNLPADPRGSPATHAPGQGLIVADPRGGTPAAGPNAGYGGGQFAPLQMTHIPHEHAATAHAILHALGGR